MDVISAGRGDAAETRCDCGATGGRLPPSQFQRDLAKAIPYLRATARWMCGRHDFADDLVQETLLKAWAGRHRFDPDSSLRAWTYTIMRNTFLSEMRRQRFRVDYDEDQAERVLVAPAAQELPLHLADVHRALQALPGPRRDALLLVAGGGYSYDEAADLCHCAVGTVKSRVGRARATLGEEPRIGPRTRPGTRCSDAFAAIMGDIDRLAHQNDGCGDPGTGDAGLDVVHKLEAA